jgi:hypothetical protein
MAKATIEEIKKVASDPVFRNMVQHVVKEELNEEMWKTRNELVGIVEDIRREVTHLNRVQDELHKAGLILKLDEILTKIKGLA